VSAEVRHIKKIDVQSQDGTMQASEMREFLLVVYRALSMVTRYLEKRYGF
jgi:hypothetical protein